MKASIVIPAYNEEKYLPLALESIMKQTYQNFEIIVVDCFSEDKTAKIAEDYGARVLQYYKGNIGATRRAGALAATGHFIVSTSADNVHANDWLEELINPLKHGYDATYGPVYFLDMKAHERIMTNFFFDYVVHAFSLLKIPYAIADSMAFEKKFYFKIGGFNPLKSSEDTDILKRSFKYGKVCYVKKAKAYTFPRRIREWGWLKYLHFNTK
ncbi:MAG: glycosyltransferase, partial [Candidatus Anstonellales archaeon]